MLTDKHSRQASYTQRQSKTHRQSVLSNHTFRTHTPKTPEGRLTSLELSQRRRKDNNYNKYYIPPSLRYREKAANPKDNPQNYTDQAFVYNNLHNHTFWNWAHPLEHYSIKPPQNQHIVRRTTPNRDKLDLPVLQRFKQYVEKRSKKRVPLLVRQILSSTRQPQ